MIATLTAPTPAPIAQVARLGFTDGWLILPPAFLNLQRPVMIIDHAHIGDPDQYGLEPFGTRDPTRRPPRIALMIRCFGNTINVYRQNTGMIIATTFSVADHTAKMINAFSEAVLLVGRTYELESTWAALWTMSIGRAPIEHALPGSGGSR
ncbi:hypothetical protein GCM10011575_41810 [Microlunatus endophyticus]|uniref:Uncharacterized protein n=1 Tax=Microlunatus endophyticus TaxID=1716077 RepID=A0A917SG04_9ACTN|nr:hypothetical protein [Microlunatus endophyticus]GGL79085.1 hypothetical protein GCM10011575_41810 [Microlunatus endophyticus]